MVKGLYAAYTGMVEEQRRLDVLSNNLANSDTVGFKKEGTVNQAFRKQLALRIKDSGNYMTAKGVGDIRLGDKVAEVYTNYDQGSFKITDVPSDIAISGKGFFAISHTNKAGERSIKYTRDGNFTVDVNGYLRTGTGDYVLNRYGATNSSNTEGNFVKVNPLKPYSIGQDGSIIQNNTVVGNVGLVDFNNYDYITKFGDNLYEVKEGVGIIPATATLEQGVLETSNVNVIDEMVNMITIQRAYEAGQKMIQTEDMTLEQAATNVGKV